MLAPKLITEAERLLSACRSQGLKIVTAESCTGGLIAALFTEIAGSSDVFERGFVTYSNEAKMQLIDVQAETLEKFGAVSKDVAQEMAQGALSNSLAHLSIAVTGIAGPGGGSAEKQVGLVHIASTRKDGDTIHQQCNFGDIGREAIRTETVSNALQLLKQQI